MHILLLLIVVTLSLMLRKDCRTALSPDTNPAFVLEYLVCYFLNTRYVLSLFHILTVAYHNVYKFPFPPLCTFTHSCQ